MMTAPNTSKYFDLLPAHWEVSEFLCAEVGLKNLMAVDTVMSVKRFAALV
jgi:hypothetical protein